MTKPTDTAPSYWARRALGELGGDAPKPTDTAPSYWARRALGELGGEQAVAL